MLLVGSHHKTPTPAEPENAPAHATSEEKEPLQATAAAPEGEETHEKPKKEKEKTEKLENLDKLEPGEVAEALKQFETQFNDNYSRGSFEDARAIALKASTLTHKEDPEWLRRTADATYLSEALPSQRRAQKALEIYSALLANSAPGADKQWAQYRVCLCLRQLGRWEDALQAIERFLSGYPESDRATELSLYRAQGLTALGHRDEAQLEIENLIKTPASREVHATALVELARMNLDRSKNEAAEVRINNVTRAEVIDLSKYPEDSPEPVRRIAPVPVDVPDAQWESIRRALELGEIKEAQRLLNPWIDSESVLSEDQRARVSIKYANMVREMAQSNPPEAHK